MVHLSCSAQLHGDEAKRGASFKRRERQTSFLGQVYVEEQQQLFAAAFSAPMVATRGQKRSAEDSR
jgi:hypothetical protein